MCHDFVVVANAWLYNYMQVMHLSSSEYCCDKAGRGVIIREYSSHSLLCTCGRREEGQVQFSFYMNSWPVHLINYCYFLPAYYASAIIDL